MIRNLTLALCALPILTAPLTAQSVSKKLKLETLKKGPIVAEPGLGYILVRLGPKATETDRPIPVAFNRIPENGAKTFPDDITKDRNFWRTASVVLNAGRSFGDTNGTGTYILKAYPGRWVLNNVGNTCLSLGTYAFDVRAGEVTDIGTVLTAREDGKTTVPELSKAVLSDDLVHFGVAMNIVMSEAVYLKPPVAGAALPAELAGLAVKPATLTADYRSGNNCLSLINRAASLPPMGRQPPMTKAEVEAHYAQEIADVVAAKQKK